MRRTTMRFLVTATVIAASACGGASGPLPLDGGGIGRDGGGLRDANRGDGGFFPDAAHPDAHVDAPPLFDSSL